MKRLLLHISLAASTFALGVAAAVSLRPVEDTFLIPPDIPAYQPSFAPVASSTMCEAHGAVMRYESLPRRYFLAHLSGTLTFFERERTLYPNSHRMVGDWYMVGDEESSIALVCPACRAADVRWVRHAEQR